jgi:hypothetical protein
VTGHFGVGAVKTRIEPVGLEDGRLQIVRDYGLRDPADELQHPDMRTDPVLEAFGAHGFGICIIPAA